MSAVSASTRTIRLPSLRIWRELAALSLIGMELSWVVPWFRSLSLATHGVPPGRVLLVLALMALSAYWAAKLLAGWQVQMKYRHRVMIALLVISIYAGLRTLLFSKEVMPLSTFVITPWVAIGNFASLIPNEYLVIMVVLFAWWRGAVLARDHVGPEAVMQDFKIGFNMFLFFVAMNTLVTGEEIEFTTLRTFFFFGLLAMSAARMASVADLRGGLKSPADRRRLLAMLLGTTFAVAVAYTTAVALGQEGAALAAILIGFGVLGVMFLSLPLLLLLVYGLFWLLLRSQETIAPIIEGLVQGVNGLLDTLTQLRLWALTNGELLLQYFAWLEPILRWFLALAPVFRLVILVGSILLLVGLILLVFYLRERRRRAQIDAALDSVLSAREFMKMLQLALKKRLDEAQQKAAALLSLSQREQLRAAARIRQIYAALINLSAERGTIRDQAQTPREFLPALNRQFPDLSTELGMITEAYLRVRYGELPESRQEIRQVENAWKTIKTHDRQTKRL